MNTKSDNDDLKSNIRALRRMAHRQALVLAALATIGTAGYLAARTDTDNAVAAVGEQADARQQSATAPQPAPADRQETVAAVAPHPDAVASPQHPSVPEMGTQSQPKSGEEKPRETKATRERSVAKAAITAPARPTALPSERSKHTASASEPPTQPAQNSRTEPAAEHHSGTPSNVTAMPAVLPAKAETGQVHPVTAVVRSEPPMIDPGRQASDISHNSKPSVTLRPELTPLQKIVSSQDRALQSLNTIPNRQ
ncbi:hypothetical protein [Magnetospirillum sulfuroxidans]|uniref:Extensin n=1 Tax=Magnetospirillum sulfuroxidans TaxID=611300 RepID=A0ABS5IGT0_9PROT|nr:hypothetical protein [Magnetospirillum sulfuroxidans]MBR9972903.1 hypothetical protein [Magnetospirillum sulfuroxidans]